MLLALIFAPISVAQARDDGDLTKKEALKMHKELTIEKAMKAREGLPKMYSDEFTKSFHECFSKEFPTDQLSAFTAPPKEYFVMSKKKKKHIKKCMAAKGHKEGFDFNATEPGNAAALDESYKGVIEAHKELDDTMKKLEEQRRMMSEEGGLQKLMSDPSSISHLPSYKPSTTPQIYEFNNRNKLKDKPSTTPQIYEFNNRNKLKDKQHQRRGKKDDDE